MKPLPTTLPGVVLLDIRVGSPITDAPTLSARDAAAPRLADAIARALDAHTWRS